MVLRGERLSLCARDTECGGVPAPREHARVRRRTGRTVERLKDIGCLWLELHAAYARDIDQLWGSVGDWRNECVEVQSLTLAQALGVGGGAVRCDGGKFQISNANRALF